MNGLLTFLALVLAAAIFVIAPADGPGAILVTILLAALVGAFISRLKTDKQYLWRLFVIALLIRVLVGTVIYAFHLQEFFGGDAITYDLLGNSLLKNWEGAQVTSYANTLQGYLEEGSSSGWGMLYAVALVYKVLGRNALAIQFINSVLGAATAPIIFLCSLQIFDSRRVARIASLLVAFFPSLVVWSAQGLKDGPIIFLVAISMLATLKLGEKFHTRYLIVLTGALFALLSLRFYVFYIIVVAAGAAFIVGMRRITAGSFVRNLVIIMTASLVLGYLGVARYAGQLQTFGTLERVNLSRLDLANRAQSGFGRDVDISTTSGAISALPIGLVYLMLAPFPWQVGSLRQNITLPEMLVWWALFPVLVLGLWFTVRHRLRRTSPILIFTSMLTVAYSVVQGNVGTAYRQRSQLLVFYFIFVAVGIVLLKEWREERLRSEQVAKRGVVLPRRLLPHHVQPQSAQHASQKV